MAFANFGEDDPFGDVNAAGAPESPVRVAIPRDLDIDEVNQLERVRREKLQTLIEEKRAVAKHLHALKCAAEVSATRMEVPSTPGASSPDTPAMARLSSMRVWTFARRTRSNSFTSSRSKSFGHATRTGDSGAPAALTSPDGSSSAKLAKAMQQK